MEWLVLILGVICILVSIRYGLLKANIKGATKDMEKIIEKGSTNQKLTGASPDRHFEALLYAINNLLIQKQTDRKVYMNQELNFKKNVESISHDLRTPLTALYGYIDLLKDPNLSETDRASYIEIIQKKTRALEGLIDSFYHFTRLETGDYPYEAKPLAVNGILESELLSFYQNFQDKGLQVEVLLEEMSTSIQGDEQALKRVFYNLIHNGLKYSETYFKVETRKEDHELVIVMSNDCESLKESNPGRLFDRFYMADQARNQSSSGLGLTISKMLVEKMNGSIQAVYDQGVIEFSIRLPLPFCS